MTQFDKAVEFASKNIEVYLDRGLFLVYGKCNQSSALGLHDKDFN